MSNQNSVAVSHGGPRHHLGGLWLCHTAVTLRPTRFSVSPVALYRATRVSVVSPLRCAVCATGIFAGTRDEARVLSAVKYPLCPMTTTPNLVQTQAKERGLPGIVLHQRPNAIILGTSMSSSSLPVEGVKSLPIA